ncbi:hypothetical protein NMY3_01763 [Candidatus Nitrosocosmicus oleophilus]|uniref:Uncharacterized protein n=2 Tax=Candidatus Nitrosocosmicus oleophilus TaxID=1353260 RepID=A0A654LZU8_9ARCH|nr:hypothetical protein NMY3_01763 [Candidatus Nitrosocosmicus oleophilus]
MSMNDEILLGTILDKRANKQKTNFFIEKRKAMEKSKDIEGNYSIKENKMIGDSVVSWQ